MNKNPYLTYSLLSGSLCIMLASGALSGCIPVVAATATSTGVVAAQERSFGTAIDDKTIWTNIKHQYYLSPDRSILSSVAVEVIEGRVLLSGSVTTQQTMLKAVELAWNAEGVKEVINEIQIKDKKFKHFALDSWVTTQVKSKLLLNEDVRSINYHVETVNGIVYLFGLAKSDEERKIAVDIARSVAQVKDVVSHIRIVGQK